MDIWAASEYAYKNGYAAGKEDAINQFIEKVKAESAVSIAGVTHYVMTEHQLEVIKKIILEETDGIRN